MEKTIASYGQKVQSNVNSEYSNLESSGKDWQYKVSQFQDKLKTHARNTEHATLGSRFARQ